MAVDRGDVLPRAAYGVVRAHCAASIAALAIGLSPACGKDSSTACTPGEQRPCPCEGHTTAVQGVLVCLGDGSGFAPCGGCLPAIHSDAANAGDAHEEASDGAPEDAHAESGASCSPPAETARAALCLSFVPEQITFTASDPRRDGLGQLTVQVYDTDAADGGTLIATKILPEGAAAEVDIRTLPGIRFDSLPSTVSVLARFDDRPAAEVDDELVPFVWLGGMDATKGIEPPVFDPIALKAGTGVSSEIRLTALRRLSVSVERCDCASPADDARGLLAWYATPSPTWGPGASLMGRGAIACANLSVAGSSAVADGFVLGAGPHYVFAQLDDFGVSQGVPYVPAPGALITPRPLSDRAVIAPTAYDGSLRVTLLQTVSTLDAGSLPPKSCQ